MGMESIYRISVLLNMTDNITKSMGSTAESVTSSIDKINESAVITDKMSQHIENVADSVNVGAEKIENISDKTKNVGKNIEDVSKQVVNSSKNIEVAFSNMQKAGTLITGLGATIVTAGVATATATFDTQDALGELASLGVQDLEAVEKAAKNFSDTWAGTSKSDFITASYDIKSGISSLSDEGVAEFTKLAALTGKATKSTTEEMGSLFATGYGIYKGAYENLSDLEFGEMFSAGISTAVKNYKTSGTEMASAIESIGATATNAKVSMEEQLAILGQLQTTMAGSEAGTKYASFLQAAASAGDNLGLSFVDANNTLLSTPDILEKLKSKYGDTIDAVEKQELATAFGTDEAVDMIDLLYQKTDILKNGIEDLAGSMKQGTSVTEEMAEAIQNTPAQKFTVLKQQIHNNVEELGKGLLPAINNTMDKVSALIQKGSDWISNNQKTVQSIMSIAMKLGIVLVVIGTVIGIIGKLSKAFSAAKAAISVVKATFTGLSAAFTASPIGLVIVGIVALVAAFVLLWNKSEAFRNFWIDLFEKVKSAFMNAWSMLKPAIENLGNCFIQLYQAVQPILKIVGAVIGAILTFWVGTFIGAIKGILKALSPLTNAFSSLIKFVTNVVNAIVALFKGDFSGACNFMKEAVNSVKDFFINGFKAITSFIGGFVSGFKNVIGGAFSAVKNGISNKLEGIKSTVSKGMNKVKGFFGNSMKVAKDIVNENLDSMKAAYQQKGGGIKGTVAATLAGVKGIFSSTYSRIDKMTGGKLGSIKDAFANKLGAARDKVKDIIGKIKGFFKFDWSFPKLKMPHFSIKGKFSLAPPSVPKLGIDWYAKGGIMTKPTIFGASGSNLLGGGEAGDEAILPLSALWENLRKFIHEETDSDQDDNKSNHGSIVSELSKKEVRKVNTERSSSDKVIERYLSEKDGRINIEKLDISVDITKIKDLPLLYKLLDELKDAMNSKDDPDPVPS